MAEVEVEVEEARALEGPPLPARRPNPARRPGRTSWEGSTQALHQQGRHSPTGGRTGRRPVVAAWDSGAEVLRHHFRVDGVFPRGTCLRIGGDCGRGGR